MLSLLHFLLRKETIFRCPPIITADVYMHLLFDTTLHNLEGQLFWERDLLVLDLYLSSAVYSRISGPRLLFNFNFLHLG